ncbi:hypothetical protein Cgig2_014685 [Carnegiea gigantea]|uniref:DNA polymerase V n=1 Tax=Carnegiea gigantea TaxID=171969 RepID=A0A9Q1QSI8_9CARY|nr:hypothetical protein Cgig2_014685 [Carnegiea gigantea]
MGSKKKVASSTEEEVEVAEGTELNGVGEKTDSKKRMKKKKRKMKSDDGETEDGSDAPSTPIPSSTKPMERKKKRKMLDKERHRVASESKEKSPKQETSQVKTEEHEGATGNSNGLPAFHIGVFSDLASVDAIKREAAAERLAMELLEVQQAYDEVGNREAFQSGFQLEAAKDDGLDDCAPSVRYAVRRLVRGVSSSRECARQGFALGLTILITTNCNIKVHSLLKLISDSLEISSSMKGQEARDCLLGRLFAYGGLARSGRLKEEWTSDKNTPYIKEFTSLIISLASKKEYLREPAVSVLLSLIEMLPKEAVINHVLEAPGIHEWFDVATNGSGNPDALLLALKIREKVSTDIAIFGKLLPSPFSPGRFFTADHLASLAACLQYSAFCRPRVHGIWPYLLNFLLPDMILQDANAVSSLNLTKKHKKSRKSSSSDEDIAENLKCFCEVILEGSLITSSHDRKHLAFDVVLLMLPRLPASCVPVVLSQKFVQCLMDILRTKDSWLHKVAEHFLKELLDWVRTDEIRRLSVVVALQKHSGGKFDCVTRTKTVKDLMAGFTTESGCMLFIQQLTSMFLDDDHVSDEPSDQSQTTDENSEIGSVEDKESAGVSDKPNHLKSWVLESLPGVLRYLNLDPEAKFRVQKEVMKFLAVQGLFSASLGSEVTSFELQEKFRWPKTPISSALCKMCVEQLQLLLSNAQKAGGSVPVTNALETNDLGHYFMHFLGTLCTIPSVSLVRPLSDEDEKAFKRLQAMESRLSREERNCGLSSDANKLHALRYLLIQLLLQLLLRPDEYSEAASELIICCQKAFSVHDLLGSSGEDELDDGESPELMDVLVDTLLSLLPQSSAPMRSAVEQVFRYFCDSVTDDGLLRMLRVIKKDLKPARHKDADSEDDDDDDLLGIEEAEEPDEANMAEAGSPKFLTVYSNMVQAFVNPSTTEGSEQLAQRMWGILHKKIFKAKDYPKGEDVRLSTLESLLEKSLRLASRPFRKKKSAGHVAQKKQSFSWNRYKMINSLSQQSTYWILKVIDGRKFPETDLQRVFEIFKGALEKYFESKKCQLKPEFLKEVFKRRPWVGQHLFGVLLESSANAKYDYRRVEALELLSEILKAVLTESTPDESKKFLKGHLSKLGHLVKELATHMPEKQSRRAEVRKFCSKVFQILSSQNLGKSFLKTLETDAHAACESHLGEPFLALKKTEK